MPGTQFFSTAGNNATPCVGQYVVKEDCIILTINLLQVASYREENEKPLSNARSTVLKAMATSDEQFFTAGGY